MTKTTKENRADWFEEIRRYLGFGAADHVLLRALHPAAKPHFPRVVDHFYEALSEHDGALRVFSDDEQVGRLKDTLLAWLDRLLLGPWDDAYCHDRLRIGRVHVKVGLPQHYMFTAMNLIRRDLAELIANALGQVSEESVATRCALDKILDFELALMLESYRDSFLDKVQRLERLEKDQLSRELEISQARYSAVVDNAAALVVVVDGKHRLALVNRKAALLVDREPASMLGAHCAEFLCHPEDRALVESAVEQAFSGKQVAAFDARLLTGANATRWVRWHATSLPGGEEPMVCVVGIDTTDERALQERTRRAERLASLGTLAAGLAHEIRNPLNAASLQLKLVRRRIARGRDEDYESALSAAALVNSELERLAGLVQDFLAFARPSPLRLAEGDLRKTLATVQELVAPDASEAGVSLAAVESGSPILAKYDEERIKQVLLNLLRNGIEASGTGGTVGLEISAYGHLAEVVVRDSGPGVPDEIDVFEPFSTSKSSGTGLGLPIVHRIVSDHGGDIQHERDGADTLFVLELPLEGPPDRSAPKRSRPDPRE